MEKAFIFSAIVFVVSVASLTEQNEDPYHMYHPTSKHVPSIRVSKNSAESKEEYWKTLGQERVRNLVQQRLNRKKAKNIILFLGDGMSIPTLAASRIYMGQLEGKNGEESQLSFEKFPVTGLSKTYCVDRQVADSACTATAYLCGVKGNYQTIGVTAEVPLNSCEKMKDESTHVHSIAKLFTDNGRSAGILTTTRITHASPAGTYAHTANRNWESDVDITESGFKPGECRDIARQLIEGDPGRHFKVILGGGRRELLSKAIVDEEGIRGKRGDGRNLIKEWQVQKETQKKSHEYVWNKNQLKNVKNSTEYLLGLFESDHCKYHLEVQDDLEPSFEEMVEAAIKILSKDKNGFFLFAEGGRIDHAHHSTLAKLALDETVEFSKGIAKAVSMTSTEDTLIVVTSDHAHTMSISGYPTRGNPITGAVDTDTASDGLPYLTLGYANGLGYRKEVNGNRVDVTQENMNSTNFRYPAMVPLEVETHGGDDVGVFALGPWQHLFTGVYEQSSIPHMMAYASCLIKDFSPCLSIFSPLINLFTSKDTAMPFEE